ncbi:MAG: 23S rRNA (pseudouridine(1915)-N(3))-methyltransferase RlmH, partial [Pseudomonadota bacterium]|nr:23S rRNA (pseudouridine(1915)-N(3))-methyltransferase RlmH [Pseudomonadota bacterium]
MRVLAIGTRMPQWVSDGADDYVKRLPREASIEWVELPASKRARDTPESRMLEEATAIERRLKPQEQMVVLDVEGKVISTETIAETLATWQSD